MEAASHTMNTSDMNARSGAHALHIGTCSCQTSNHMYTSMRQSPQKGKPVGCLGDYTKRYLKKKGIKSHKSQTLYLVGRRPDVVAGWAQETCTPSLTERHGRL